MTDAKLKPMLAVDAGDLTALRYPLLASTKLDGIRATIHLDGPKTRSLKDVPNKHIRSMLAMLPAGLDGELGIVKDGSINFRDTTSAVMRESGEPDFRYFVFDDYLNPHPFQIRVSLLGQRALPNWVVVLEQHLVHNATEVSTLFAKVLDEGHEGLILRDPLGRYKHGRSTLKEHGMLKVKPWVDTEGVCVDVIEEMHNTNTAEKNELGRTKRSQAQAGLVGKGTMGTLVIKHPDYANTFEIGTGFDAQTRKEFWENKPVGRQIKFKYVVVGGYDVPRHCVFLGIRDERDM